jgi:hypothetical protein
MSRRLLKHFMQIAGILVLAGLNVQSAQDSRPSDVTIYVNGDDFPPIRIDFGARATVTRMYARIGIRLAWRHDAPGKGTVHGSPVPIQMRFGSKSPENVSREALAFARPFADGVNGITVIYERIRTATGGSPRVQSILAHVLAHEIAHVLMGTDGHAETGIMKAHWNGTDYAAMKRKPLEFTPDDVDMIIKGLNTWKSQNTGEHSRP